MGPKRQIKRTPAQPMPLLPLTSFGGLVQSGGYMARAGGSLPGVLRGDISQPEGGAGILTASSNDELRRIVDER